jgi:hypothetical protein
MPTPPAAAIQAARDVLTKCAAYDPWFPHPTEALILAWAEQIALTNLTRDELLAGVTDCYRTHGAGFKPLPADIIGAAKTLRHDHFMRQPLDVIEATTHHTDARLAPIIAELATATSIPDDDGRPRYQRPTSAQRSARTVPCPWCKVGAGQPCYNPATRRPFNGHHDARINAAAADQNLRHDVSFAAAPTTATPLCRVCGAHALQAIHEAERGVCETCWPTTNHYPHADSGQTFTLADLNGNSETA